MNEITAQVEFDYSETECEQLVGLTVDDLKMVGGGECVVNSI